MGRPRSARSKAPIQQRLEQSPKTADISGVELDILGNLLSFYMRSVGVMLNRDFDHALADVSLAHGTGKVSTLLMVGANPGIRPSMLAHYVLRDRAAMTRLLQQMKKAGLIVEQISSRERRARELYLTAKGKSLVEKVRALAAGQSEKFFSVLSVSERDRLMLLLKKLYQHHVSELPAADED
ncbi:MAG: winged helix-turn-helix transcriptional regulator [Alphaproteobacteria bacterium]|nr:winged helix-turn-helix transcriptional regulator [Alphaproteobacteria bacterium]